MHATCYLTGMPFISFWCIGAHQHGCTIIKSIMNQKSSLVHFTKNQISACSCAKPATHLASGQWSGLCPVGRFLDADVDKIELVMIHSIKWTSI